MVYNNEQDKFTEAELKGRAIMDSLFNNTKSVAKHNFSPRRYDVYDGQLISSTTSGNVDCYFEIKYRDTYSSTNEKIKEEGAMLEHAKKRGLLELNTPVVYYFMLFNDGVGYAYNLREIDFNLIPSQSKWIQKTTMGDTTKVLKSYYTIPLSIGTQFKFNRDKLTEW